MSKVSFLPQKVASEMAVPVNMISLNSPNDFTRFAVEHKRLLTLSFYPNDYQDMGDKGPTEETAKAIVDFIDSCNGEDIVVHCGEGRIRSAAVAEFIQRDFDYRLDYDAPGSLGSTGGMSKHLYRLLRRYYDPIKKERKAAELAKEAVE